MDTNLEKPGRMIVQFDTSDHKIYFNLDRRGIRGTLILTKKHDGKTEMHIYQDNVFGRKRW
ncbi:MAG: hypothetical protein P4N41_11760 [Negativicutes bacterium]|nr:hypothetical protein [Negativicutes bacterium]